MGWTGWTDTLTGTTSMALATVVFDGKLHVFATGIDDKKIYVKSSSNGKDWGNWDAFGGTTDAPVAPAVFGNVLHVFAKGLSDDKVYVRQRAKRGAWTDWKPFGGTTDVALSAATFNEVLYVFAKGLSDNKVYFRAKAKVGAWTDWEPFGGTTDVPVTPVAFRNRLYVFAKGLDDDKIYQRSRGPSGDWNAWQEIGGSTETAVAAVVFAGDLHLFSKGQSDNHVYSLLVGNNNNWSPWYPVTPVDATISTAVAAANFKDTLHLFAVGVSDRKVYTQRVVVYDLPFDLDGTWVSGGNWDTGGHGPGEQAFDYDFGHPEGGNVRAVRSGKVILLENHSEQVTPGDTSSDPNFAGYGTVLHIRHDDGSVSAYLHLKFNSIRAGVVCGGTVEKGQVIALSGHTGISHSPHLHFGMQSFARFGADCRASATSAKGMHIPVYFKARGGKPYRPPLGDAR